MVLIIAMIAFLRIAPLGVTAEISSIAKTTAGYFQIMPSRLDGLDTVRSASLLLKILFGPTMAY